MAQEQGGSTPLYADLSPRSPPGFDMDAVSSLVPLSLYFHF